MKKETLIETYKQELQAVGQNMSILLVEDDLVLQSQMKKILLHFFARIDCANNGVEALTFYERRKYEIIITDLTMPVMNGIELAKEIKERDKTQSIFVASAHNESEKLIELINIGIDGFVLKPLNIALLLELLQKKCEALYNAKMKSYYSNLLDVTHEELKERNRVLEETLNTLAELKEKKEIRYEKVMSASEFLALHLEDATAINEELHLLEESFNYLLLGYGESKSHECLAEVSRIFKGYSGVLERLEFFHLLSQQIESVCESLEEMEQNERLLSKMMVHFTELFDQFELFRKEIFEYKSKTNIFLMVSKMLRQIAKMRSQLHILKNETATKAQH
jgi:YesN/AraC family two-component response regulator